MHSDILATLYLTLAPSAVIFIIAIILRSAKINYARPLFFVGLGFLLLPIIFVVGHFTSLSSEMKNRAGTFVVVGQQNIHGACSGKKFDSLQLILNKNGEFSFNYEPCFSDRVMGKWKWTDNMVHSYSVFDKLNDSLELDFSSEFDVDTIVLTNYHARFLTFARVK